MHRFKASDLKKLKVAAGTAAGSDLEAALARDIKVCGLPPPNTEYHLFAEIVGREKGVRKRLRDRGWKDYRFDFAWPTYKIVVEVQGGLHLGSKGGHTSKAGSERDCKKLNDAVLLGWCVLQFTSDMISSGEAVTYIEDLLKKLGWEQADDKNK